MCTFSVGLRGLTPVRAARSAVENFPKPVNVTSPLPFSVSVMASRNASTALAASRLDNCARRATSETNSCFVTLSSSRRSLAGPERPYQLGVCRSTMRFCGGFLPRHQVSCPEKGAETDRVARESVGPALLPIDHTNGGADDEPGLTESRDRLHERSAGGHDVLHQTHELALLEGAFEPVRGAVGLRLVTDDHERQPSRERGGRGERHRTEHGRSEAHGLRLVLADGGGDPLTERGEKVRPCLEAELVEVVARALAGPQKEVALEVGRREEPLAELRVVHRRPAATSTWRASGSSRAASGEPAPNVTKDPSSK